MSELVNIDDDGNVLGRYCVKCWNYKDADQFSLSVRDKYCISNVCKECCSPEFKFWYSQNRDGEVKRVMKFQKANPQKTYDAKKRYYTKNQGLEQLKELTKFKK